jgi:hypothetical protein
MLAGMLGGVYAQDSLKKASSSGFVPQRGDFTGAILFGRSNYFTNSGGLTVPNIPNVNWTVFDPRLFNNADNTTSDATNIVGGEGRYFFSEKIAIKLAGAAILRNTPSRVNTPAVINPSASNATWIPAYNAIQADNSADLNLNLGVEKHFAVKYNRMSPYVGLNVPFYYARRSLYDPTIDDTRLPSDPLYIRDVGVRHSEIVGFGLQAVGGVDYYLAEGVYFGVEIRPISYVYAYSNQRPGPGLELQKAENTTLSFFSQTFLKLGFKF